MWVGKIVVGRIDSNDQLDVAGVVKGWMKLHDNDRRVGAATTTLLTGEKRPLRTASDL